MRRGVDEAHGAQQLQCELFGPRKGRVHRYCKMGGRAYPWITVQGRSIDDGVCVSIDRGNKTETLRYSNETVR